MADYVSGLKRPVVYWQYKSAPKFKTILDGLISAAFKMYPCEIWELLQLDTATGYALDLIGQRLGYPRPKEVPEAVGRYDLSRYAQAYYDMSLDKLGLVQDDTYRYMLKLRVSMWQPWRPLSITQFYKAMAWAMPGVNFYLRRRHGTPVVDCYIMSYIDYPQRRALYSDAIKAPIGETLLFVDKIEEPTLILTADGSDQTIMTNGAGRSIIANQFF